MRAAAALLLVCAVAGCRATPAAPPADMALDLSMGGGGDFGGDDLAMPDMACAVGPEICGNGCDDDRNGYTDADDPACTSQMLVTLSMGSPARWRLGLEPTPHTVVLDGNPITTNGAMATYNAAFAPAAFLAFDSGTKLLERLPIGGGTATTKSTAYSTRDVCVFNGELLVVDPRSAGSYLHRFKPDGATELGMVSVPNVATACSSDGNLLYVVDHPVTGPSQVDVFTKGANGPVATTTTLAIPDELFSLGYDRIVDLAYIKKSGLFVALFDMSSTSVADSGLDGKLMATMARDGGFGAFIDGGVWHGVGEFMP